MNSVAPVGRHGDLRRARPRNREHGGTRIVAVGRREVLGLYRKVGLKRLGREARAGAVRFELMAGTVRELSECVARNARYLRIVARWADLPLGEWGAELPADA